jgi:vesicle coat complex subunit
LNVDQLSSIQDIFRKYPSTYEGVIPTLCANLDELDEPDAKASLIWIIGEYANKIDNADELLGIFVDTFTEESYPVRSLTLIRARFQRLALSVGPVTNTHSCRKIVFAQAGQLSRISSACIEHRDERL